MAVGTFGVNHQLDPEQMARLLRAIDSLREGMVNLGMAMRDAALVMTKLTEAAALLIEADELSTPVHSAVDGDS